MVHQKEDKKFAELLGASRTASCIPEDYTLLQSRNISLHNLTYPALHASI